MDTLSRGDWSRCSVDLTETPVFDGSPRPSLFLKQQQQKRKQQKQQQQKQSKQRAQHQADDTEPSEIFTINDPDDHGDDDNDEENRSIERLVREMNHYENGKDTSQGSDKDEATPLMLHHKQKNDSSASTLVWTEGRAMVFLAVPVILTYLLEMLPGIVSIVLVGHIVPEQQQQGQYANGEVTTTTTTTPATTKEYLDATALAVMYVNLTAISIGFGLASALDTLCSQAYGAGELAQKARIYLTTGLVVLSAVFFGVMFILNWQASYVLQCLGQPVGVAQQAGIFVKYLLPGIPALFVYELLRKLLQAENVALPMFYVALLGNLVNAGLGYWLIFHVAPSSSSSQNTSILGTDGWLGAAVARTTANLCFPLFMIGYLVKSGRWKDLWSPQPPFNGATITTTTTTATTTTTTIAVSTRMDILQQAIAGIPRFISLGIPGALQLCFEWWAFECLALLSGLLPNAMLAIGTNAILLNIASMVYMLYLGVSIAANVRIGNALGAHDPVRARVASHLAFCLSIGCALCCATLLLVFRKGLPRLFTQDPEIAAYCSELLWIAACFQGPDSLNATVQGIFRGSGRQSIGAWLNFVAYYAVGLPIGIALAFAWHMGLEGLWIGITAGLLFVGAVGSLVVLRSNWEQLSKDAIRRLSYRNVEGILVT